MFKVGDVVLVNKEIVKEENPVYMGKIRELFNKACVICNIDTTLMYPYRIRHAQEIYCDFKEHELILIKRK